jgi:hypothetical protein
MGRVVFRIVLFSMLAGAAAIGAPSRAHAAAPAQVIEAAIGNTVVVTYPDGMAQRLWLHPRGLWDGQSRHGNPRKGRWTMTSAGAVCLNQIQPPTVPLSYCTVFPSDLRVGLTWGSRDLLGRPVRMALVKGIVTYAGDRPPEARAGDRPNRSAAAPVR